MAPINARMMLLDIARGRKKLTEEEERVERFRPKDEEAVQARLEQKAASEKMAQNAMRMSENPLMRIAADRAEYYKALGRKEDTERDLLRAQQDYAWKMQGILSNAQVEERSPLRASMAGAHTYEQRLLETPAARKAAAARDKQIAEIKSWDNYDQLKHALEVAERKNPELLKEQELGENTKTTRYKVVNPFQNVQGLQDERALLEQDYQKYAQDPSMAERVKMVKESLDETDRMIQLVENPEQALEEINGRIETLRRMENMSGGYYRGLGLGQDIEDLERQRTLLEARVNSRSAGGDTQTMDALRLAAGETKSTLDDWARYDAEQLHDIESYLPEGKRLEDYSTDGIWNSGIISNTRSAIEYIMLTDGERKAYDSMDAAGQKAFMDAMRREVNQRIADRQAENTTEMARKFPVMAEAAATGAEILKPIGSVYTIVQGLAGNDIDPNSMWLNAERMQRTIRETHRGDIEEAIDSPFWGKAAAFGYDAVTGVLDNATRMLAFGSLGSKGTTAMMGLGVMGGSAMDASEGGANSRQALAKGAIDAAVEVATEYLPIERVFETVQNADKMGATDALKNLAASMLEEGAGESLSTFLSALADKAVLGERSDYNAQVEKYMFQGMSHEEAARQVFTDILREAGYSGAVGAVSGGLMQGGAQITNGINHRAAQSAVRRAMNQPQGQQTPTLQSMAEALYPVQEQQEEQVQNTMQAIAEAKSQETEQRAVTAQTPAEAVAGKRMTSVQEAAEQKAMEEAQTAKAKAKRRKASVEVQQDGQGIRQGETEVNLEDLDAESADAKMLNEARDLSGAAANDMLSLYDEQGEATPEQYAKGYEAAYKAGLSGKTLESTQGLYIDELTDAQKKSAWLEGKSQRAQEETRIDRKTRMTAGKYNLAARVQGSHSGVSLEHVTKDLNKAQVAMLRLIDSVCKRFGVDVRVYDTLKDGAANAYYEKGTNVVRLALDAQDGALTRVVSHELYHYVERFAKEDAAKIRQFVLDKLRNQEGYDLDERIAEVKELYARSGVENVDAESEIVADSMLDIIATEETLTALAGENKNLLQKIKDHVQNLLRYVRETLRRVSGHSEEVRVLMNDAGYLQEIIGRMEKALQNAQRNYEAQTRISNTAMQNGLVKNYQSELQNATNAEGRKTALDNLVQNLMYATQENALNESGDLEGTLEAFKETLKRFRNGEGQLDVLLRNAGLDATTDEFRAAVSFAAREMGQVESDDKVYNLNDFGMEELDKESKNNIQQRGGTIVKSRREMMTHVNTALDTETQKTIYLGAIAEETKKRIEKDTGVQMFKPGQYSFAVSYDDIRHIEKHFKTREEIAEGIERVYGIVARYDEVQYEREKTGQERLTFEKTYEDADYLAVEVVSKRNRAFDLVTVYATRNNKKRDQAGVTDTSNDPGAPRYGSASDSIIGDDNDSVNGKSFSIKRDAETERVIDEAVKRFGTTERFEEAGYILPDGRLLRMTDETHKGERWYDHRAIAMAYGQSVDLKINHGHVTENGEYMNRFVEGGSIRFDAGEPDLNMDIGLQMSGSVPMTREQERTIRNLVEWKRKREEKFANGMSEDDREYTLYSGPLAIRIDFGANANYAVGSASARDLAAWGKKALDYQGGNISANQIVNDVRRYYETGETNQRRSIATQFHENYSLKTETTTFFDEVTNDQDVREAGRLIDNLIKTRKGSTVEEGAWRGNTANVAQRILDETGSSYNKNALTGRINKAYEAIDQAGNDQNAIMAYCYDIGKKVAENAGEAQELDPGRQEARDYLRNARVYLNEEMQSEVRATYGSVGAFMRRNFGKAKFTTDKNATGLEEMWSELHDMAPGVFKEETPASEMPLIVETFLESTGKMNRVYYNASEEQIAQDVAMRLFWEYFQMPGTYTDLQKREQEMVQRLSDTMDSLRDTFEQRVQERMEQRDEQLEKVRQRNMLERTVRQLTKRLTKPTKQNHIPEEYRGAVAAALELVNTSGNRKSQQARTERYNALLGVLGKMKQENPDVMMHIDPDMMSHIEDLKNTAAGKSIMAMNRAELEAMNGIMRNLQHACVVSEQLLTEGKKRTVRNVAEGFHANMERQKDRKVKGELGEALVKGRRLMQDAPRFFNELERVGGKGMKELWNILRHGGLDTQIRLVEEAEERVNEAIGGYDYQKWNTMHECATESGPIKLTTAQIMSLYLLNKRQQARNHIYGVKGEDGGIAQGRVKTGMGKYSESVRPSKVSEDQVNEIIKKLTKEQREAADKLGEILSGWCADLGNETSMQLYGYKKFTEKNYFPIQVWDGRKSVTNAEQFQNSLYSVMNKGFTKELQDKAQAPLVVPDIFDAVTDHINGMIVFRAWSAPVSDVIKFLNYKYMDDTVETVDGEEMLVAGTNILGSVKEDLDRVLGKSASAYMTQLLEDINGLSKNKVEEKLNSVMGAMTKNFKATAVGANIGTIIKQPFSVTRAFDVIPAHYFVGKPVVPTKKRAELMSKYAPIYYWKQQGNFTMDTGKSLEHILLPKKAKATERISDWSMAGAGAADSLTWHNIWNAAENMVKAKHKDLQKGTDAYYKRVAEIFNQCIDETQTVDSILHRTEIMRSKSGLIKSMTTFMGEPMKTWNMFMDAVNGWKKKDVKSHRRLAKTGMVLGVSIVVQEFINSLVSALRNWDDEDPFWEQVKQYFLGEYEDDMTTGERIKEAVLGSNLVTGLNPMSYIPVARDMLEVLSGYTVERVDMTLLQDVYDAFKQLSSETKGTAKKATDLIGALGNFVGIPAGNIIKEAGRTWNYAAQQLEAAGVDTLAMQYAQLQAKKDLGAANLTDYAKFILKARTAGNDEMADRVYDDLLEAGAEENKLDQKLYKLEVETLTGMSASDVSYEKTYGALAEAMKTGETGLVEQLRAALARVGKTEDQIADGLANYLKENDQRVIEAAKQYANGNMRAYTSIFETLRKEGFSDAVAKAAVNRAYNAMQPKKESTQSKTETAYEGVYDSTSLKIAVENGSAEVPEILADLRKQGKTDTSIKSSLTSYFKPLYKQLMRGTASDKLMAEKIKKTLLGLDLKNKYTEKAIKEWLED